MALKFFNLPRRRSAKRSFRRKVPKGHSDKSGAILGRGIPTRAERRHSWQDVEGVQGRRNFTGAQKFPKLRAGRSDSGEAEVSPVVSFRGGGMSILTTATIPPTAA